jgi:formylglycine-generating enzyme required for sulfatase activity
MSSVDVTGVVSASPLDAWVTIPGGDYRLGDGGHRVRRLGRTRLGRWPVTNAQFARFVAGTGRAVAPPLAARLAADVLADHPVTEVAFADALAYCAWAGARLPTGDEWEAAARGPDGSTWPWGDVFDPERCNCAEAAWGWTVPVTAHPQGAAPCGAEQLAGNVWEWVADPPDAHGWRTVRGGSYLDTSWGVRAARTLPADPLRATVTTGFRIVTEAGGGTRDGPA